MISLFPNDDDDDNPVLSISRCSSRESQFDSGNWSESVHTLVPEEEQGAGQEVGQEAGQEMGQEAGQEVKQQVGEY